MNKLNLQRIEIEKIYGKVSPFEFKNELINLATKKSTKSTRTLLDAGRGNPNWTASTPREAFFTFGQFAVCETKRVWSENDLAGMPQKNGIYERLCEYLAKNKTFPGTELIKNIVDYGVNALGFNPDCFVYELTDGIIGDNYPFPDRMLTHIEKIVTSYLLKEMHYDTQNAGDLDLFAVEGATAGMCYIFDSLKANELLVRTDKIAIMTPIFTPYLEIPQLPRYDLDIIPIKAIETDQDGVHTWQYPTSELDKLKDKSIKALFVVNPSNPPSMALSCHCIEYLIDIIKNHNENLMIISDDVYGTFVNDFKSLMSYIPYNTIGVYSFSKYFGVTGWRLGTLALHKENIFDKLIENLSIENKEQLSKRYGALCSNPEKIPFIDRIVADSRQVALNHTAGLSTPQQVQMAFFCAFALLDKNDRYKKQTIEICRRRKKLLFDSLGLNFEQNPNDASYYTEFDLLEWAHSSHGEDFVHYLQSNYKPLDVLFNLAKDSSIVLLGGGGFAGPQWSIRISLANLDDSAYSSIGDALSKILKGFVSEWKNSK